MEYKIGDMVKLKSHIIDDQNNIGIVYDITNERDFNYHVATQISGAAHISYDVIDRKLSLKEFKQSIIDKLDWIVLNTRCDSLTATLTLTTITCKYDLEILTLMSNHKDKKDSTRSILINYIIDVIKNKGT